jgi:hypothetical protein
MGQRWPKAKSLVHRLQILMNVHNSILNRHLRCSGEVLAMLDLKGSAFTATHGCNLRRRAQLHH